MSERQSESRESNFPDDDKKAKIARLGIVTMVGLRL